MRVIEIARDPTLAPVSPARYVNPCRPWYDSPEPITRQPESVMRFSFEPRLVTRVV
jgi:hypothetical protein